MANIDLHSLVTAAVRKGSERTLWTAMLREDIVYRRIPEYLRETAVTRAAEHGRRAAADTSSRFVGRDPVAISGGLGVRVDYSEEPYVFGKIVLTSTYNHKMRTITVYRGAVRAMNEFLVKNGLVEILGIDDVGPLYVAHELFHHLEEGTLGRAADLLRITTLRLGPFKVRSGIRQMSEIGADAYAQQLLGVRFAPRLLDYLTIYIHNEQNARRLIADLGLA